MKRKTSILILLFCFFTICSGSLFAKTKDAEVEILDVSEGLFKALQQRDYQGIWERLTLKSRDTIVKDVYKAQGSNNTLSIENIRNDFMRSGPICKAYWEEYLFHFDPRSVLNESSWKMGSIGNDEAEITITYRKSSVPAELRVFKEDGAWRVGLVETFWTRK